MLGKIKKKETLEDILSVFTETKSKLKTFIDECNIKDAVITSEMSELQAEREQNNESLTSAQKALFQINNIVGE